MRKETDKTKLHKDPIASAALEYARAGLRPVAVDNIADNYSTYGKKDNLPEIGEDPEKIIFQEFAGDRLGKCNVALNVLHSALIVIDVDNHGSEDGNKTLSEFEQTTGQKLPETVECLTPRNGRHFLYTLPEHFAEIGSAAADFISGSGYISVAGIEIMKNNSTVTMPPSIRPGVGTEKYLFVPGHSLAEIGIAPADNTVVALLEYLQQIGRTENPAAASGFSMPDEIPGGTRQNTLMRLTGSLHAKGLSDDAIKAAVKVENETRCKPPLSEKELEETIFPVMAKYPKGNLTEKPFAPFQPFDRMESPEKLFPVDVLPPVVRNYCAAVSDSLQVPVDMPCIAALGVLSAALSGKYFVEVKKDWKQPVNLYLLLIARPSERKSPVMEAVARPLYSYQNDYNSRHRENIDNYTVELSIARKKVDSIVAAVAGLKRSSGKAAGKEYTAEDAKIAKAYLSSLEISPVTELSLLLDDATPEAVASKLFTSRERAAIFSAEGGGILGMMQGRYTTNTNIDIFLKAYSGEEYRVDRIGRPSQTLHSPLMTLLLMAQQSVLASAVGDENLTGRGLTARFLYSIPKSKVGARSFDAAAIPEEYRQQFDTMIKRLLAVNYESPAEITNTLTLTPEAVEVFREYSEDIEKQLPEMSPLLENWSGKIAGAVARIAALLMMAKTGGTLEQIDGDTMRAAVEIGRYFQEHALYTFEYIGAADSKAISDAKYIFSKLLKSNKSITRRDLQQSLRSRFPKADMMAAGIRELESHGYIRISKVKTGGAPSEIIEINSEAKTE
jgi:hypothetical protein